MKPTAGQIAPDFELPSNKGGYISLSSLKGQKVILYFYPKDDTPGCTKEACSFRDVFSELTERRIIVLGISKDDINSHNRFAEKYHLPFILLSDISGETVEKYGVWVEKNNYGKKYMGIERTTFLIDEQGVVRKVWEKVNPEKHISDIIEYLEQ